MGNNLKTQLEKDHKIAVELEERKTLFISPGNDVWTPTFLAGTKEHVCYHTSEAQHMFTSSHTENPSCLI